MKKLLFIISLFCFIFIIGCTTTNGENKEEDKKENPPTEINYDAYKYNYDASIDIVEKLYDLRGKFSIDGLEKGYKFIVTLTPKVELAAKGLKVVVEYNIRFNMYEGDSWRYKTHSVILNSFSRDTVTKETINDGMPFPANKHEILSSEIVSVSGKIYTNTEIKVETRKVYVEDEAANKLNYDKFIEAVSDFNNQKENEYYSINYSVDNKYIQGSFSSNNKETGSVKMKSTPFYMETLNNEIHSVIIEEDNKYFGMEISNDKINDVYWVKKNIIAEGTYLDELVDLEDILEGADVGEINYKLILVELINNKYVLSGYYKDLLPQETLTEMQALFNQLGYKDSVLQDATFKMTYDYSDEEMAVETFVSLPVNDYRYDTIETTTAVTVSYKEFEQINFNDKSKYYIKLPNSMDSVTGYTNVLEDVESLERASPHYYLVHLESGQYYFNDYNEYANDLRLEIYYLDQEKVELGHLFGTHYYHGDTFTIPEGDYYLEINNTTSMDDYKFVLEKLNYQGSYNYNNPNIINDGNFSFSIEGKYDLVVGNYVAAQNGIIHITNNTSNKAMAYYLDGLTSGFVNDYFGDNNLFRVLKGDNYFYLHGDENDYNYEVKFYAEDEYKNKDKAFNNLEDETDWLVTGPGLEYSYATLNVEEKGIFTFTNTLLTDESNNPQIHIIDTSSNQLVKSVYSNNEKIVLDKGNYLINISSYGPGIFKITVSYDSIIDVINDITLETFDENNVFSEGFPKYQGVSYTNNQQHKYGMRFTLSETSNVLICSWDNYTLYDSNDKKISVADTGEVYGGIVYNLDPGTYTVQIKTTYDVYSSYFLQIAILTCVIEDDNIYNINNIADINLGNNVVTKNYNTDVDILKLVIAEETTYIIDNSDSTLSTNFIIYDENLDYFTRIYYSSTSEVTFPEGTYYFVFLPSYSRDEIHFRIDYK